MRQKLLEIERAILEALEDASQMQPHDAAWRSFVGRLESAKVAIWHAMNENPT